MLRPVSLLPALVAAATLAATLVTAAAAPATAEAPKARTVPVYPLAMTIDSLSSSEIPRSGPVVITGSVTNRDVGTWETINVYPFIGDTPITTTAGLAAAAKTPAGTEVGERIIDLGDPRTEYTIDELGPGETAQFVVTVPHGYLTKTEGGVYWFGVHALGSGPEGRVDGADGRARTFLPYVPPTQKSVDTALVVPLRRQILHAADGSIDDLDTWTETLSPGGSLSSLVDLGVSSGSRQVSWLVDPALVDAVSRIAAGNPPRSLASTIPDESEGENGSESESPSPSPTESEDAEQPEAELSPEAAAAAEAATDWLERLHDGLEGSQILALPYGDTDVAAAAAHDPTTYRKARKRATGDLQPWGLPTTPAVSSPTGYIDIAGIQQTEPGATLLVTDQMFRGSAPAVAHVVGRTLGVTSSGAVSGGPGPNERRSPLAVRQRIVSEAAIRLLTPGRKPLIVVFPATWRPDTVHGFFDGLDLPWLNLTSVTTAMQRAGTDVPAERLQYPDSQTRLELDPSNFAAAATLTKAGDTLQNLLTQNDAIAGEVADEAFSDTSYSSRLRPETARLSADESRAWIAERLASVHINAPKAVILSSGSGQFAATVSNQLDEPVTVKIQAIADPPLRVAVPADAIDLAANSRATVLLRASSSALGVRSVTLSLTDSADVALGSTDQLPIRSNRVSAVIWLIIGTGVALLFGAIIVRLYRRVRAARAT